MDRQYSLAQFQFLLQHAKEMTAKEMSDGLKLPIHIITGIGYRHGIQFKKANRRLKENPEKELKHVVPKSLLPDPEPQRKFERVKGEYSNGGYLQLLDHYA